MAKLFAISGDPDQMPHCVAWDLGLHCLSVTLFGGFQTNSIPDILNFEQISKLSVFVAPALARRCDIGVP